MIIGTGIDIVRIDRMKKWIVRSLLLQRYFHDKEIEFANSKGAGAAMSFAARFAAKEAFGKALGTGLMGISLKDICIENNAAGKPAIVLYGTAKEALKKTGANYVHVSLTHETDNAAALVILEK